MQTEVSPSERYRLDTINKLKRLAEFHGGAGLGNNNKSYRDMTRQHVIDFLDSFRKPESVDPLHKWVGSYNLINAILLRFFRWLYYPDISPSKKRPIPGVMANIPKIRRKETSIYKPTEMWTEDDVLFYKYCPSVRDRCWHAMSRDTGCRASELLKLKIKDVVVQQLEGGYTVAKITVNGKTGVRNVRLFKAYPLFQGMGIKWTSPVSLQS
jgi:integrase